MCSHSQSSDTSAVNNSLNSYNFTKKAYKKFSFINYKPMDSKEMENTSKTMESLEYADSAKCEHLKAASNGEYPDVVPGCSAECQTYHKVLYLEQHIGGTSPPALCLLERFLDDDSPLVRSLAQRIALKFQIPTRSMVCDPTAEIRALHLKSTQDINELLRFINDENQCIRLCILKRLRPPENGKEAVAGGYIAIPASKQEQVLLSINHYINDKNHVVRLEFVHALCAFNMLSPAFICRLFDKKNLGLFIYGAEDEMHAVRNALMHSIEAFAKPETAKIVFEYLIDMLNDEAECVRGSAIAVMGRLTRKYVLYISDVHLPSVMSGLEESSSVIQDGILEIIANSRYESIDVYFYLIKQTNLGTTKILHYLRRLIKKNRKIFKESITALYEYTPFSNCGRIESRENDIRSLYNAEFLAELVLLRTLQKYSDIKISRSVLKCLGFLKLKLHENPLKPDLGDTRVAHQRIMQLISDHCADPLAAPPTSTGDLSCRYLNDIYLAYCEYAKSGSMSGFYQAYCNWNDSSSLHHAFIKGLWGVSDRSLLELALLEYLSSIQKDALYGGLTSSMHLINVPCSVSVSECLIATKLVQFKVHLCYTARDGVVYKLVVEEPHTNRSIEFQCAEQVQVVLSESPPVLWCYMVAYVNNCKLRISQISTIKVVQ